MTTMNLYDMTDTWNAGATTFTAVKMNVTDTASASGSLLMDLQVGGVSQFNVSKAGTATLGTSTTPGWLAFGLATNARGAIGVLSANPTVVAATLGDGSNFTSFCANNFGSIGGGFRMPSPDSLSWTNSISNPITAGTIDLSLFRDAADTLAQRRGTGANPQAFRIYNTFTDISNYERGVVGWASNVFVISAETLGTGTQRVVEIRRGSDVHFRAGNGETFVGAGSAPLITLGTASASTSARIGFFGGAQLINSTLGGNAAWRITDSPTSGAASLIFGGNTSSFPALKRNSTSLQVRLADDSADAPFTSAEQTITGTTLTGSSATSTLSLAQTWNTSGTPTAIRADVTDTASAAGSLLMDLQVGGVSQFNVRKDGKIDIPNAGGTGALLLSGGFWGQIDAFGFALKNNNGTFVLGASGDTILARDAADTLAQRRGTNAQAFRIYNTFTDASNYERGRVAWESNTFVIGAQSGGTGTPTFRTTFITSSGSSSAAQVRIGTDAGGGRIWFTPANLSAWEMSTSGHFLAGTDNAYDIGASGASRPRNIHIAANAIMATSGQYNFSGRGGIRNGGADGILLLQNEAFTDFTRLQLGGTTNSFGAIARDGAGISIVGAAGGSTAHIKVPGVTVANLPAAATAGAGARSFVTDALTPVFGSAVVGGGAVNVPVYSDGAAWNVG